MHRHPDVCARFVLALATTLVAPAVCGTVPLAAADATQPVRILLLGDSVTQGSIGDWTWRYRLWQHFADAGVAVDFVGPESDLLGPRGRKLRAPRVPRPRLRPGPRGALGERPGHSGVLGLRPGQHLPARRRRRAPGRQRLQRRPRRLGRHRRPGARTAGRGRPGAEARRVGRAGRARFRLDPERHERSTRSCRPSPRSSTPRTRASWQPTRRIWSRASTPTSSSIPRPRARSRSRRTSPTPSPPSASARWPPRPLPVVPNGPRDPAILRVTPGAGRATLVLVAPARRGPGLRRTARPRRGRLRRGTGPRTRSSARSGPPS